MKQMIVMRTDLKMRRGKEIAQGAHASMKATLENLDHPNIKEWLAGSFTKVAVAVNSEEELMAVYDAAKEAGLIASVIVDSGKTEFNGVPTTTCIAVGPATHEELIPITGSLKLR
jgi:PTH2 family peptidyl-tRNA hydrolase